MTAGRDHRNVFGCLALIAFTVVNSDDESPGLARSCIEICSLDRDMPEGNYWLEVTSSEGHVIGEGVFFCSCHEDAQNWAYLPLPAGERENYSWYNGNRSYHWESCSRMQVQGGGKTHFRSVAIVPAQMNQEAELIDDDFRFAQTVFGSPRKYGTAGDCMSNLAHCHEGHGKVDLTGTGFTLHPQTYWYKWGHLPSKLHEVFSPTREVATVQCGGACGWCRLSDYRVIYRPELATAVHEGTRLPFTRPFNTNQVSFVTWVFNDTPLCPLPLTDEPTLDLNLRDGNRGSCLDLSEGRYVLRVSHLSQDLARDVWLRLYGESLGCSPGDEIHVMTSEYCDSAPCGSLSLCATYYTEPGYPCRFRCCGKNKPCGTFYVVVSSVRSGFRLCELEIL